MMKSSFLSLAKIKLISQLGINGLRYEKDKKKILTKILILLSILITIAIFVFYSGFMAYQYIEIGLGNVIPVLSLVCVSVITIIYTMLISNGELFAFKDYDLLMSLPISTKTVVASRFLNIYIWNTFFSFVVMLPMGVIYCIYMDPPVIVYFIWLITLFLATLVPTTIGAFLGAIVTAVASRFKNSNVVMILLTTITMGLTIAFIVLMQNAEVDAALLVNLESFLSNRLIKIYPLARLFQEAVVDGIVSSYLTFVAISLGWYILFERVLAIKYKQINSKLSATFVNANYEIKEMKQQGQMKSLYKKEINRFFSSFTVVMNIGIGAVMTVVGAIALVIYYNKLVQSPEMINQAPTILADIIMLIPFGLAAVLSMSCYTSVALSLEGKNVWIIKSLPISPKKIYNSKIAMNLTLCLPAAIVSSLIIIIGIKPNIWSSILILITPIVYSFLTAVWGIFINNRLVNYEWETEAQLVKQSISSMAGMFGGMLFGGVPLLLFIFDIIPVDFRIINLVVVIIVAIVTGIMYSREYNRDLP